MKGRGASCFAALPEHISMLATRKNSAKCHKEGVNLARRLGDKTSLFDLSVLPFLSPHDSQIH